jgi:predicted DCC family thiol-disulfide oxidoreductase YuxK
MSGHVEPPLILYDGVCGLCDRFVRRVLRADGEGRFHFAPLQGETAARILAGAGRKPGPPGEAPRSVILVLDAGSPDQRLLSKSDAVLEIYRLLGGIGWAIWAAGRAVPRFVRDGLYDFIAARRYRWFGRFDACTRPPEEWSRRFLP